MDNSAYLPSYDDLNVPELKVSYPFLKAGSQHLGKFCEEECKEFMLCRREERDPRKCLGEGKDVTSCGIRFFQKVKKHCRPQFDDYSYCIDHCGGEMLLYYCRPQRLKFDECMEDYLGQKRPDMGYFIKPKVHETNRPKPVWQHRDYEAEAAKLYPELPEDSHHMKENFRQYYAPAGFDLGLGLE